MKVNRITAQVRYSQDTGHSAWKAIEIGAEATVDEKERWSEALAHLYADLGRELKTLWAANGNGHKLQESPQVGAEGVVEALQPVEQSIGSARNVGTAGPPGLRPVGRPRRVAAASVQLRALSLALVL